MLVMPTFAEAASARSNLGGKDERWGGWRMEDGGWRMEDGGWMMEDRG